MNKDALRILTVGNPNSGKTSLFNALTGSKQRVGNWPGVTVDRKIGYYYFESQSVEITDLPGLYTLEYNEQHQSLDYSIAIKSILSLAYNEIVVNIVDSTNLERNLYLSLQLREMQCPMVMILNKIDLLEHEKQSIDIEKLSEIIGCPVFAVSAHNKHQVTDFKKWLNQQYGIGIKAQPFDLSYGDNFELAIKQLSAIFAQQITPQTQDTISKYNNADLSELNAGNKHLRNDVIRFLSNDTLIENGLGKSLPAASQIRDDLEKTTDIEIQIADVRYSYLHEICQTVRLHHGVLNAKTTQKIDNILLHRFFGVPCFLAIMYLMFMFSINIGNAFIDFFDISVGAILVDGGHHLLDNVLPLWATTLLVDGVFVGIQTVATFIPVIFFLYVFMSLLESTGYMARAAFVLDKLMQKVGLPGKAFVPLILGFGCNVPSIMATRTLEHENERKLTAAMVPFMSCGARLPVYALFAAAFFPHQAQNVVFGLYILGIFIAMLTGLFLRYSIFPVQSLGMVMEMPNYEFPTIQYIWIKTIHKLKRFIFGAGKVIIIGVTILSMLNSLGTDGSFGNNNTDKSVLANIAKKITPILKPIGVTDDNWQATVGIITGVLAKEAVVGTLNALYSNDKDEKDQPYDLAASLMDAFKSIPQNLLSIHINDPLKLDVGETNNLNDAATVQNVHKSTFGNLQKYFVSMSAAFAYLIFVLLYTPCMAALGAYSKEFGNKFMGFIALWTLLMAYTWATIFYQLSHFAMHPITSCLWIVAFTLAFSAVFWLLRRNNNVFNEKINVESHVANPNCCE